jgi:hypothetical protein
VNLYASLAAAKVHAYKMTGGIILKVGKTMRTDLYTKIILTIIAVCLSINLIKDVSLVSKVEAQNYSEISRIPIPVNLVQINGSDLSQGRVLLPVRVVGPVQVERE